MEPDELAVFLKACDAHETMGMLFRLMLDTGLRKGEALALTWADLDLEASPPRLSVTRAWTNSSKDRGFFTKPKSKNSKRVVPIPPETASRLRVMRQSTTETYGQGIQGLHLFGSPINNTPFDPYAPNHALQRICDREGLKHIRPHDLRHTYGSILLANGVKLEVVSKRMGHANPTITLNVYRHLLESEVYENVFEVTSTATAPKSEQPQPQALPN